MTEPARSRRPALRLWVIALALYGCGFVCYLALNEENVGYFYPASMSLQMDFYGAGLFVLWAWIAFQARSERGRSLGCLGLFVLAFLAFVSLLISIPK